MKIQITRPFSRRYHYQNAVWLAFLMLLVGSGLATAQTLFQDSFSYSAGTNLASQGGWTSSPSGDPIVISPGSLSIPGFAPSSGNSVGLTESNSSSGVVHSFAAQTSGNVYMSFILDVSSLGSLTTSGTEIAGFTESGGQKVGNIWVRSDNQGFDIGGTVDSATAINWNSPNTGYGWALGTYLIVEQIQFPFSENSADVLNAWISPAGNIPGNWGSVVGPSAIQNSDPSAPISDIAGSYLLEGANSPNATVDEIRVGDSWADVTPTDVPEVHTVYLLFAGFVIILSLRLKQIRSWLDALLL